MKSRNEFESLNEYRDYLRDYYAGQILAQLSPSAKDTYEVITKSRYYAITLVKEHYGDWT